MSVRLPKGAMAVAMALSFSAVPASAVPIEFDEGEFSSAKTYTEGGFVFEPASLNNSANCPGDDACLLANNGPLSEIRMTAEGGGTFDVDNFLAEFAGNGGVLEVIGVGSGTQEEIFKEIDFGNDFFLAELNFTAIEKLLFKFSGGGTARIDNIVATAQPIPLPASLPLLLGALGGLAYVARRRRGVTA